MIPKYLSLLTLCFGPKSETRAFGRVTFPQQLWFWQALTVKPHSKHLQSNPTASTYMYTHVHTCTHITYMLSKHIISQEKVKHLVNVQDAPLASRSEWTNRCDTWLELDRTPRRSSSTRDRCPAGWPLPSCPLPVPAPARPLPWRWS